MNLLVQSSNSPHVTSHSSNLPFPETIVNEPISEPQNLLYVILLAYHNFGFNNQEVKVCGIMFTFRVMYIYL